MARLNSVRILLSVAVNQSWPLYQLESRMSFFMVDDIIISGSDSNGIADLKQYLQQQFHTRDLGHLRYFLGIEVVRSSQGLFLSQRKYVLDLLTETGLLGTRPSDTPMDSSVKPAGDTDDLFTDIGHYHRLVGKLIYLTVTHPDITYVVGVVTQFMHAPRQPYFVAMCRILQYLKRAPGRGLFYRPSSSLSVTGFSDADWAGNQTDRRSTSGYCTFVGGNLVTWHSKKQTIVVRSSAVAEYRAMAHTASEILWVQSLLQDFGFSVPTPMTMSCDNQAAIFIANNPVFHERTKHIEVDCHFIHDLLLRKQLVTPYVHSEDQLGDILTKPLARPSFHRLSVKLDMFDLYAPA
ncbi:uncharacterized protein LOC114287156 [Camellia sinensis]|uniref:uncharacterized protein LOC114287156 n=1 Tax=Camellia sinensis TaxID=4442 RepID=UPI001035A464|nr:uncharacterized protein LOC114287156 [Camellia sinensis]